LNYLLSFYLLILFFSCNQKDQSGAVNYSGLSTYHRGTPMVLLRMIGHDRKGDSWFQRKFPGAADGEIAIV